MLSLILYLFLLPPPTLSLSPDGHTLLTAKQTLHDPDNILTHSWSPTDLTPCNWHGVTCDPTTHSVTSLTLTNANLAGPFPSAILCGKLPNITVISFYNNALNSTLSGSDLSLCSSLTHLDLAENYFIGPIPAELSNLPQLSYLDLSGNNFSGSVPHSFTRFPKLEVISLMDNLLDGVFPNFLSNVTTLRQMNLSGNPFKQTRLGEEIGNLLHLEILWLAECNLIGHIPNSIGRLNKLTDLDLSYNMLNGSIPTTITGLVSAVQIELYENQLSGKLPVHGWANLTSLRKFDASVNKITGRIPDGLTRLPLESLNLCMNDLEGELPESIADSPNLYELVLYGNRLSGKLPMNLGEHSPLFTFDVSYNMFSGEIPPTLCAQGKLDQLLLIMNSFSGEIPTVLGECRSLTRVRLRDNKLSGEVPDAFWGLPNVLLFEVTNNSLTGGISKTVRSAWNLSMLEVSNNFLSGEIPKEIGYLSQLERFFGSDNGFSGSLPSSITKLDKLSELDLHSNELSGVLPDGMRGLKKLNELNLANNKFSGEITADLGSLSGLNYLDLSRNKLSGKVPDELENLKFNQLNLSNNQLSGRLPSLFASKTYMNSFWGNPGLCGGINLPSCHDGYEGNTGVGGHIWWFRWIFILAALILVAGLVLFYCKYRSFKRGKRDNVIDRSKWTHKSFHKLGFNESEILNCLDEHNVIGIGASGKVYKAVVSTGETVAVKKLWNPLNKLVDGNDLEKGKTTTPLVDDWFEAEVETLGKIRHKNIVRLWCCCVTSDCKLLVYEYMPNGSLGDFLHSSKAGLLDWPTRYAIALDAAEGLSYLHHDCGPPIVHRDVKSNNILLDANFNARVADFGVAKVVVEAAGKGVKSMSVIAGSCGYIAPEYAYTLRVNEKSDIYSFGVVILELVTGKQPVDPEFGEKDIVKWVCTTLDQKGIDHILDSNLDSSRFMEEMSKVLSIGLLCTTQLPINRPSMRKVVKMLQEVRCGNQRRSGNKDKDGTLTPYYYEDASDHGN